MVNEKRLIDYNKMYLSVMDTALSSCDEDTIFDIMDASVVDAVEVVRCKDCVSHNLCKFEQYQGLDGFCSYGGSKEDETD